MAYDQAGRTAWRTDGVGVGELLDVADLDGDGRAELLFSVLQRLQFDYNAATGPGRLLILDALSGNILWTHQFERLEFGFNRRRTLVASTDGGRTQSIFGVLTYSPSLWRVDFNRATGGRIAWRSEPLAYDSPDAAPLLSDLDGDQRPEIIVDSNGQAYVVDVQTGAILARDVYADHFSFFGFLNTAATPAGPVLFDLANSVYGKTAAAFQFDAARGLRRLWSRTWDAGLTLPATDLASAPGLVQVDGRGLALWSLALADSADEAHVVQAVDPRSGDVVFSAPLGRLVDVLQRDARDAVLVTAAAGGVRFTRLSEAGFAVLDYVGSATWLGASRGRPPSRLAVSPWASTGLLRLTGGTSWVVHTVDGEIVRQPVELPSATSTPPVIVGETAGGALLVSNGGTVHVVGGTGVRAALSQKGRLWATPLVGQLDADAALEVVVPVGRGLGRVDFSARHAAVVTPFGGKSLPQERETFHIPAIAGAAPGARVVVGYEYAGDGAKVLVGRYVVGVEVWQVLLDQTAGELSIVAGRPRVDGGVTVFQHDNHGTRAVDAASGRVLWIAPRIGQCQRQIAAIDWNRDGIDDVAAQSGDIAIVLDGRDGRPLFERPLAASYGAYVATAQAAGDRAVVAMVNAGGLGLFDATRVLVDRQVQPRGLEMIPLVVGPGGGPVGRSTPSWPLATGSSRC